MNYQRLYTNLINSAKDRIYSSKLHERHHILPRALGGDDSQENLVSLTHKEHFVAHKLLKKIYPNERSMCYALWLMVHTRNGCITSKEYATLKEDYIKHTSQRLKGRVFSEEHKNKLKESRKELRLTTAHKEKISDSLKGKKQSDDWKRKKAAKSMRKIEVAGICFLSIKEACSYFKVTDVTIGNWRKQGKNGTKYID